MKYTAGQAAKAAGVATSTVTNALKSGKISGEKDANGSWRIEPAELHRLYPPVAAKDSAERDATPELERLVGALQEQIADLRVDRDHWRAQVERLTLRIPAQAADAVPAERPAPGPSWFSRIFGR